MSYSPKNRWRRYRPLFASPVPSALRKPKIQWKILPILMHGLRRTCTVLGAMILISAVVGMFLSRAFVPTAAPALPDKMVLFLKFDGALEEYPSGAGLAGSFSAPRPTVHQMIHAVHVAARDPRVHGILAYLEAGAPALAQVQELRAALAAFRKTGKFAHIYSRDFGQSLGGYYLASAFDQLWIQPMGTVFVNGIQAEMPFFRRALDKIGIEPQFVQREEYKTAYDSITRGDISAPGREMLQALIDDLRGQVTRDIERSRGLSGGAFDALVNTGLFTAPAALKAGLVSRVGYADMLAGDIAEAVTGVREDRDSFIGVRRYLLSVKPPVLLTEKPKVALVYAAGTILSSAKQGGVMAPALMGDGIAAADEIAPAIMQAARDPEVQAIILRIDSPGGSPAAAETILRAVTRARAMKKPVIVSMGEVAASGGYWIAAYADKIFANPATLTGSIGVLGGKFSLEALWDKTDITWARVGWGQNAGLFSPHTPFSAAEKAQMEAMLDHVYDAFLDRVAQGRNMSPAQVKAAAKGRVWSGSRAAALGLADAQGGLTAALDYAATLAGAASHMDLQITVLPKPKTPFEQFVELLGEQGLVSALRSVLAQALTQMLSSVSGPEPVLAYEPVRVG